MKNPEVSITPEVLSWARESIGYSIDDIVEKLKSKKVTAATVTAWERGSEQPTYTQLEKLADTYKRPIALFFLPKPPEEEELSAKLRSLPSDYQKSLPPAIRYLVRTASARQIDLADMYAGTPPGDIHNFRHRLGGVGNINLHDAKKLAVKVRRILDVPLTKQWGYKNSDEALKVWRQQLENLGIWVFKEAFHDDDYCGFCVHDENFPIIYINNSTPKNRQIFTLFHELGHLLAAHGGVDFRKKVEREFGGRYRQEEVFCNAFAGSLLVPDTDFSMSTAPDDEEIRACAAKYKVSREVILRRCLDKNLVTKDFYNERVDAWNSEWEQSTNNEQSKGGGGDYYANQVVYLGHKYLALAFKQYYQHRIDEYQLSDLLGGVKIRSLETLEEYMLKGIR